MRQVELRYPGNYGNPGCPRGKKRKFTPEQMKRQNETNRIRRLQRIILANFFPGKSWSLTLNYRKDARPDIPELAKKQLRKLLGYVRTQFKKAGYEFKWIAITEFGKRGKALHHHIILENIEGFPVQKIIREAWMEYGSAVWADVYEDGQMERLAAYLVKMETVTGEDGEPIKGTRYSHSRNLIIPQPERKQMKRRKWPEEPRVPQGWELIKETLYDGVNPVTGYPYRHYSLRKIVRKGEDRYDSHNIHRKRRQGTG